MDSTLNRHGDQAYMEDSIRKANGATNFVAEIIYPNTKTQIPSEYKYTYTLKGNIINDNFPNLNPDKYNNDNNVNQEEIETPTTNNNSSDNFDVSSIDTNGNGTVTISEAKKAGISMPVCKGDPLYKYMRDNDGDGCVGEW